MKLYQFLAQQIGRLYNLRENVGGHHTKQAADDVEMGIEALVKERMPSGSGFDAGTKIDLDRSTHNKLVFTTSFHHMSEHGFYDGWTDHTITVKPDLMFDFTLTVGGRNRNDIKELIHQSFNHILLNDEDYVLP